MKYPYIKSWPADQDIFMDSESQQQIMQSDVIFTWTEILRD